jgi:hypothetical protein
VSATEYYNHSTYPATGAQGSSSALRAELELIEAGFGKLPDLSGNGGKIVAVNSGATAIEAITTTGTGSGVRATSPTLTTPNIGTPSAGVLTSCTGLPVSSGISGLGANVATALAVAVGTDGAIVVKGGALGTPSSGVLTGLTGAVPTAAQPNITSVGTLTSLNVTNSITLGSGMLNFSGSTTGNAASNWVGPDGVGGVFVNAPTGEVVTIGVNNTGVLQVNGSGLLVTGEGVFANGYRASGAAALGASGTPGLVSFETPITRIYTGDGTGYSLAFAKRSASSTTDLVTIADSGTIMTVGGPIAIGNTLNSVSPTSPNRTITMVVNGTTVYIAAKTTND